MILNHLNWKQESLLSVFSMRWYWSVFLFISYLSPLKQQHVRPESWSWIWIELACQVCTYYFAKFCFAARHLILRCIFWCCVLARPTSRTRKKENWWCPSPTARKNAAPFSCVPENRQLSPPGAWCYGCRVIKERCRVLAVSTFMFTAARTWLLLTLLWVMMQK